MPRTASGEPSGTTPPGPASSRDEVVSRPPPRSPLPLTMTNEPRREPETPMIGTETISRVIGKDVYDASGQKIGSASEVYLDDESGQPEWVTVRTGLFGTKESFVPIRDADLTDDGVRVPVSKDQVKDAPKIDADGHLSPQDEQELYRYYSMDAGTTGRTTTESTTGMATTGMTDTGMTDTRT